MLVLCDEVSSSLKYQEVIHQVETPKEHKLVIGIFGFE